MCCFVLASVADPKLNDMAARAATAALAAVAPKASLDDVGIAVGVVDRTAETVRWGGFNETRTHYPASAIKLFWLAYARHRIAEGKLKETPKLDRAMHDMTAVIIAMPRSRRDWDRVRVIVGKGERKRPAPLRSRPKGRARPVGALRRGYIFRVKVVGVKLLQASLFAAIATLFVAV